MLAGCAQGLAFLVQELPLLHHPRHRAGRLAAPLLPSGAGATLAGSVHCVLAGDARHHDHDRRAVVALLPGQLSGRIFGKKKGKSGRHLGTKHRRLGRRRGTASCSIILSRSTAVFYTPMLVAAPRAHRQGHSSKRHAGFVADVRLGASAVVAPHLFRGDEKRRRRNRAGDAGVVLLLLAHLIAKASRRG